MALVKRLPERLATELGKKQCTKQCSRTACEPLVNCNDGSIILLNLLLAQCKFSDKRHVKIAFNHSSVTLKRSRRLTQANSRCSTARRPHVFTGERQTAHVAAARF